jgi:hypothetical protein
VDYVWAARKEQERQEAAEALQKAAEADNDL